MRVGLRFCVRCGVDLKPGARFCTACGRPVPSFDGPTVTQAPSGGGPPPRQRRRPRYLIPLIAALAVLAAGGSAGVIVLTGHSTGHPVARNTLAKNTPAAISPTIASPLSSGPASASASALSSAPSAPPSQVTIGGTTIGISAVNTDPDATAVAGTLAAYFGAIDNGNYQDAWNIYTVGEQAAVPYDGFATELSTTQDTQVAVQNIQHDGDGNLEASISFQSLQAGQYGPDQGETCTNWTLDYHLVPTTAGAASYLIDKVTSVGSGHTAC